MRTNWRSNTPVLAILSILAILFTTSLLPAQADPRRSPASRPLQTCDVPDTPYFTEYYGTVTLDGQTAPAGTRVEAFSPRGDRAGCVEVTIQGYYPYMRVYREDPNASPPIPGMRPGDNVTFKVNGQVAQTDPSSVTWTDDLDQHQVNLIATQTPTPCIPEDVFPDGRIDVLDLQRVAAAWRHSPADPNYTICNVDGNNVIDMRDVQKVAFKWNTTCGGQ